MEKIIIMFIIYVKYYCFISTINNSKFRNVAFRGITNITLRIVYLHVEKNYLNILPFISYFFKQNYEIEQN